jgi:hypothetical protein
MYTSGQIQGHQQLSDEQEWAHLSPSALSFIHTSGLIHGYQQLFS